MPYNAHLHDILYKKVIYIAYSALYSTNSKQNKMEKQTAVLWVMEKLYTLNALKELNVIDGYEYFHRLKEIEQKGLTMEIQQAQEYAEFAIRCDRMGMKILNFDGFIKLKQDERKIN